MMIAFEKWRTSMCRRDVLLLSGLLVLLSDGPAYAYLDAGTGSMILQLLLGGVAGILMVGRLYYHKIKKFFGGLFGAKNPSDEAD